MFSSLLPENQCAYAVFRWQLSCNLLAKWMMENKYLLNNCHDRYRRKQVQVKLFIKWWQSPTQTGRLVAQGLRWSDEQGAACSGVVK